MPLREEADESMALDFNAFTDGFIADVQGYASAQKDYLMMHATEKACELMGKAVEQVAIFALLAMSLLFLNVALAYYLGDLLASLPLGFSVVAGFYLLVLGAFLIWWRSGARERFMMNRINDLSNGS